MMSNDIGLIFKTKCLCCDMVTKCLLNPQDMLYCVPGHIKNTISNMPEPDEVNKTSSVKDIEKYHKDMYAIDKAYYTIDYSTINYDEYN